MDVEEALLGTRRWKARVVVELVDAHARGGANAADNSLEDFHDFGTMFRLMYTRCWLSS